MEHRALAALCLRLAGVLVIVLALKNAAQSFGPFFSPEMVAKVGIGLLVLSTLVSVVLPVALGLVLIYFPSTISTKILRIEGVDLTAEADLRPLQRVAFSVIGLWLTIYAVLDALYVYSKTRMYLRFIEDMPAYSKPPAISPDDFGGLIAAAFQLVIGLWLLLGNRGVVNLLARLRG